MTVWLETRFHLEIIPHELKLVAPSLTRALFHFGGGSFFTQLAVVCVARRPDETGHGRSPCDDANCFLWHATVGDTAGTAVAG
jgi:hypothetical protein